MFKESDIPVSSLDYQHWGTIYDLKQISETLTATMRQFKSI